MIRPRPQLAVPALALLAAVALSGCVTIFPKAKPAQLYRFELPAQAPTSASAGPTIGVLKLQTDFDRAAQADTILTITGGQAAYISGARWLAPASMLFDDAVDRAFANGPVNLLSRGDVGRAAYSLRLTVRRFETDYAGDAPPSVHIAVDADLTRNADRALVLEKTFEVSVPASDNRVGPIIDAYDAALGQTLPALAQWTAETAAADAAHPAPYATAK